MTYMQSAGGSHDQSVRTIRACTTASLIAYPAGALLREFGPNTLPVTIVGYGLILLALCAYAPLIGTWLQRIVSEDTKLLDEYELRLRGRALSTSYMSLSVLILLLVLYAAMAADKGWWAPGNFGVFWGVFLYVTVLPTAILSWMVEPTFTTE